jgi:tetratricopeptide (TPR) repeat protein
MRGARVTLGVYRFTRREGRPDSRPVGENAASVVFSAPPIARQRRLVLVLPGLIVVAGGLLLAIDDGGFPATVWYPAALFALVLLTIVVLAAPPAGLRPRTLVVGLCAYGLFTALAFASMAWADAPGEAWTAANRIFLYGLALLLVTLQPWNRETGAAAVGLAGFGTALIAVTILVDGVVSGDPSDLFLGGRLAEPAGYLNATANLWLIGFWPCLYFATRRATAGWLRGLGLAAAVVLLQLDVLSQSRGAVIAFAASALVFVILTPRRWPALFALGVAIGLTALAFGPLVDVRDAASAADLGPALDDAARAIALCAAAAFVLGLLATVVGRRAEPELERRAWVPRAGNIALAALVLAGLVAVLAAIGNPSDWVSTRWDDFKNSGYSQVESGRTRFTGGLGSNRYDFYRVALDQFEEKPLLGVGGDNFADAYLLHRRTSEAPRHPHSLAFRVLSQYGLVGALLFVAFLGAMLAAVLRARRLSGPDGAALVAGAFGAFAAFFFHALVDWLWAFPALGVLAFAMLGVAARIDDRADGLSAARGRALPLPARVVIAVLVIAGAVSLAIPGIAARYTTSAYEDFQQDPATALDRLDRAADLNPLSDEPLVAEGVIEQRLGRPAQAVSPLREAIDRRPGNWFSHLELGLALAETGHPRAALESLREASRLNPRQPLAAEIYRMIRSGRKIDAEAVEQRLYRSLQDRLQATDPDAASHSESD